MPIGKVPIPVTHVTDEPLVSICVNKQWVPAIMAMVTPARYPEFWGGTLEENRRARLEVQNLLIEMSETGECSMSVCCTDAYVTQRINPTTGMVEISTDNGATYQPAPNSLPTMIVEPVPPVTSGVAGAKCDAVQNVMTQIEAWITHVTNDFDTATDIFAFGVGVVSAIADAVLLILSEGALTTIEGGILAAIAAAVAAVYAGGKTLFSNYWTDDVKKTIKCDLYDAIGDDGSFTDATFSAYWNQVNLDLPGAVAKMLFMGFMSSTGRQGLNAMAASGRSSGSTCSECTDLCALDNWHTGLGTETSRTDTTITMNSEFVSGSGSYAQITTDDPSLCCKVEASLGEGFNIAYIPCGQPILPENFVTYTGGFVCASFIMVSRTESATFEVTYTFEPC